MSQTFYAAPCLKLFPPPRGFATLPAVTGVPTRRPLDHGRQPAPAAFPVVPKLDNRVRVAENPPSSADARSRTHSRVKGRAITYATARLRGLPGEPSAK